MNQIITLKNGLRFVVVSKVDYNEDKYLCLSTYDKDIKIVFTKIIGNDRIVPVEDGELILKLFELAKKDVK